MLKTAPCFLHFFVGGKSELLLACYCTLHEVDQATKSPPCSMQLGEPALQIQSQDGSGMVPMVCGYVAWKVPQPILAYSSRSDGHGQHVHCEGGTQP